MVSIDGYIPGWQRLLGLYCIDTHVLCLCDALPGNPPQSPERQLSYRILGFFSVLSVLSVANMNFIHARRADRRTLRGVSRRGQNSARETR